VAVALAFFTPPLPLAKPIDAALAAEVQRTFAAQESELREAARVDFPADAWSQSDAFHSFERTRAVKFAAEHGVRLGDVFGALDEGIRSRAFPTQQATVPPCRPRARY
jgi:hypothetical protein